MAPRGRRPVKRVAKAAPTKPTRDVTVYAEKDPTDYHKAYARWIVSEVGYDPNSATSKRAAFLAGVSIATAARPAFMESDYLSEWREKAGVAKRGPKPKEEEEETPRARKATRRKPEPEPEEDDEEFEEEDDEFDEEEDDEEFEDDSDEDDEETEDDEFEDDEEEDEPEPPARTRRQPARKAVAARKTAAPAKRQPARKAAPVKATGRRAKPASDEDDFIF